MQSCSGFNWILCWFMKLFEMNSPASSGFPMLLSLWFLAVIVAHSSHANVIADWGTEPLDDGARCDVNAVRRANREQLHLLLEELTNTTFFRLFRVGLDGDCPFAGDKKDESASCAVEESASSLGTSPFQAADGQCKLNLDPGASKENALPPWALHKQPVDRTISVKEKSSLQSDLSCETPDFWFDMCHGLLSEDESKGWVNLQLNPERHTGYNGSKVWKAIYEEACFPELYKPLNKKDVKNDTGECGHEERVLQRLLSGLHASINTHISLFFFPTTSSTSPNEWKPNPARFMKTVGTHPDRLRNLNFAFVVLLRALRKASPILSSFSYDVSGDPGEDLRTAALVRRLLDSHIMSSCSQVFDSFDESLMFQNRTSELKKAFKQAFIRISKTFDCIKCQKCRLHGKLQLTGIGTALKILLLPEDVLTKTPIHELARREEIVALFNTLHKFSHAIASVDFLTELSFSQTVSKGATANDATLVKEQKQVSSRDETSSSMGDSPSTASPVSTSATSVFSDLDQSIAAIAKSFFVKALNVDEESRLLQLAISRDVGMETSRKVLGSLARHYGPASPSRFALHARNLILNRESGAIIPSNAHEQVVVVVGSGLAGSSAVLSLLDSGHVSKVILVEKQHFLGGNSVYASSGMNAVDDEARSLGDSVDLFAQDMARSSGRGVDFARTPLVKTLTSEAESALKWVRDRVKQPFSSLGKLGGHSKARTHRPEHGMAGAELVYAIHKQFKPFLDNNQLEILKGSRVTDLVVNENNEVQGVEVMSIDSSSKKPEWRVIDNVAAVIFATGGFSANRTLLPPWMRRFGTTNGVFATGDAVEILTRHGAEFVDMDKVQLHPTAFSAVTSTNDQQQQQPLCAEILRGVGGILLNAQGERFCDELGTRAYVSQKMLDLREQRDFVILLSADQASKAQNFVSTYEKRGLLRAFSSVEEVESGMNLRRGSLKATLSEYAALATRDTFGKTSFPLSESFLTSSKYFAGRVQPAVHYCMGGVAIDDHGRVLRSSTSRAELKGVYAAGEVAGGVHGDNRLGGNGMTEGVVFGRKSAMAVINDRLTRRDGNTQQLPPAAESGSNKRHSSNERTITAGELANHSNAKDCWVAIHGKVYDFTAFLEEHPGGAQAILDVAGKDGTELYDEIHTIGFLDDFIPLGVFHQSG